MKFLIDLKTFVVKPLPQGTSWQQVPGTKSNGQHYQLAETILAEYHPSEGEMVLLHPETSPTTGHEDIKYYSRRRDGKYGVSIVMYSGWQEVDFTRDSEVKHLWPSGGEHLFQTIFAAENYLAESIGYVPRLMAYLVRSFRHTPSK